ncbi:MAG: hypothetical protein AD742_06260 [Methylibium sp. NZG]|nr:MAG: hypothetical protein AD742_06260 [Methylibium sp. NZG]
MVTRQRKSKDKDRGKAAKVIWRISASAPLGEYVHAEPAAANDPPPEVKADDPPKELAERGWHYSTHELAHGLDMTEEPIDTLPNELFDQFFKKEP